jgi:hypothetical protein
MATLQNLIDNNSSLTFNQLEKDKSLVIEIQIKLSRLGFYPGGDGWIDGKLGRTDQFSWMGLTNFCNKVGGISIPTSTIAIDRSIAQKLLDAIDVPSVLNDAKNTNDIFKKLEKIQSKSPIVNKKAGISSAFVSRTIKSSPFELLINNYPDCLEQKPDGINISFSNNLSVDYPKRTDGIPSIDGTALNFLDSKITHACLCIGGFTDGISPIKARWFGREATKSVILWWSTTKFIGMLNTVCQINEKSPTTDIENCTIREESNPNSKKRKFLDLVKDMVSYEGESSNGIGELFKSFTRREILSDWIESQTGSKNVNFKGDYAYPGFLIPDPVILDKASPVLKQSPVGNKNTSNQLSAYDLVRLISMLGWHPHLLPESQLASAQWSSLKDVAQAMGYDTARYVDVALETLGLINVISEPVIISKVGWGSTMTYAAFVKFVDHRTKPGKLRTFALSLRCDGSAPDFDPQDTQLAAAVTEIIRRIVTEELV